jgi:DNA-binding transcriptional LysR family regulator
MALPRPELELRQLHAFVVLAEELHFGRAAARLGIAQPPLSQQIQRLERRVGHRLLARGGATRLALTPAGQAMLPIARQALDDLESGLLAARRAARGETGLLRIGFTPSIALTYLPPLVRDFRERYPHVDLHLTEHPSAAQIELVRSGGLDTGFLRDLPPPPDLSSRIVASEPIVVLLPRQHRLASRRRVALTELANEPFLVVRATGRLSYLTRFKALCRDVGFQPDIVQEVGEWSTVAGLVSAGLGVALAPASVTHISLPGMVYRTLSEVAWSNVLLFWREGSNDATLLNFIELCQASQAPPG